MAIMRKTHDRGISIKQYSAFNYDGKFRESISREEAAAILDYRVEKVPLSFVSNGETRDAGMFGLMRTDIGELVCDHSVGDEFSIPMNGKEVFDWVYDNIATPLGDMTIEDVVTMRNGGSSFFTFKVGDSFKVAGDRSEHMNSILFADMLGVSRLKLGLVATRIWCRNSLRKALRECEFAVSHTTNANIVVCNALESVRLELENARDMKEQMNLLASKECDTETFKKMLDTIYPITGKERSRADAVNKVKRELVTNQFETDDSFTAKTLWTATNAFTYFSNNPVKLNARTDAVGNAFDNINGTKADFNTSVLNTALSLAA